MTESKATQFRFLLGLLLIAIFIAKVLVTGAHHITLADAILLYQQDCLREHREILVSYDDKEDYYETLFRWWDWSDKRILSEEDYVVIGRYIGKVDSTEFLYVYFGG